MPSSITLNGRKARAARLWPRIGWNSVPRVHPRHSGDAADQALWRDWYAFTVDLSVASAFSSFGTRWMPAANWPG